MCLYSRDSASLAESWTTSASSVTSPARRRYENSPRDNKHHVPNYTVCGRDSQPTSRTQLVISDVVDSLQRGRRRDIAAAAADEEEDEDEATSARHNQVTRTAVRPWLLHSCHHWQAP